VAGQGDAHPEPAYLATEWFNPMAKRSGVSSRKRRRRRRHWLDEETSENLPAYIPVELDRLPKETADVFRRFAADWEAAEPAAKAKAQAEKELHERFAKRMAHRAAVRDGLLPPPWMDVAKRPSKSKRKVRPGAGAIYDRSAIRAVAEEARKVGQDAHRSWFYERVRELCRQHQPRIKTPANRRTMGRIVGDLYVPPKR
jgi:hypothetical protein